MAILLFKSERNRVNMSKSFYSVKIGILVGENIGELIRFRIFEYFVIRFEFEYSNHLSSPSRDYTNWAATMLIGPQLC